MELGISYKAQKKYTEAMALLLQSNAYDSTQNQATLLYDGAIL